MYPNNAELYKRHISTHTERSSEDRAAVSTLETFLISDGKINTNFSCDDKWPNHDGTFEFVSHPEISRCPEQNFIVQIKGTHNYKEKDGIISYLLPSLAFPAFIANDITADPGILFIVLNPDFRGKKRVFWKYLSPKFIKDIDFEKNSTTIKLSSVDEIEDTDESINLFCSKLQKIVEFHLFLRKLNRDNLNADDAIKIVNARCEDISFEIDRISKDHKSRDYISRKIVNSLYDLCYAVLILNAKKQGFEIVDERLAWEVSQFNIETQYLSDFLKGIKYIGARIPDEGQSERLMLKYYNYLWNIRNFLKKKFGIVVMENLEDFPLNMDTLDTEYYEMVSSSFPDKNTPSKVLALSRYYIQKKTPFFVKGERYFEITLQLAETYATKFNRVTVYTKQNISTRYSVQIAYTDCEILLWNIRSKIKVVTNWQVSISPQCLNKLAKILGIELKISKSYGEYRSLMNFLTYTGINLFDLINLKEERFQWALDQIYEKTNTSMFKEVILKLREDYSVYGNKNGKYTIRYLLLNLREEVLDAIIPNTYDHRCLNNELHVTSKCYPFERNPFISNLAGKKTSRGNIKDILEISRNNEKIKIVRPYLKIEKLIHETGELYFDINSVSTLEEVSRYNAYLDQWERGEGFSINIKDNLLSIDSYEKATLFILEKLLKYSKIPNEGQKEANNRYLKQHGIIFEDPLKKLALKNLFVNSQIMLIYGAAGTGKTTLINYISNMMYQSRKLFLTKTHTALQNLQRRIENPGKEADFICIDSYTKKVTLTDYDIVFVDECSTIDNRTMKKMLEKIGENTFLVLAGDIYQIESIDFGNWFYYAKDIIKTDGANIELVNTWRTHKEELKSLWDTVRKKESIITEKLAMDGPFSANIGEEIFEARENDEIILCLNYDGKFGLNNMNAYFQNANTKSKAYTWNEWTFKVGDPIIFLDNKRSALLYNNLKGKIADISIKESTITFVLDIDVILTERQCKSENFEFIKASESGTRISLDVISRDDESITEDERINTIIPFQIAYAVSIHKAQGLEYESVKVVIPSYNAEKISHSIFYTAITRAKEKLRIYWSAETMENVVKSFERDVTEQRTLSIIKQKLGIY